MRIYTHVWASCTCACVHVRFVRRVFQGYVVIICNYCNYSGMLCCISMLMSSYNIFVKAHAHLTCIRNPLNGDPGRWSHCRQQWMMFHHDNHRMDNAGSWCDSWKLSDSWWFNTHDMTTWLVTWLMMLWCFWLVKPFAAHRDEPIASLGPGTSPRWPSQCRQSYVFIQVIIHMHVICMFVAVHSHC